jgi:hypothetical protein
MSKWTFKEGLWSALLVDWNEFSKHSKDDIRCPACRQLLGFQNNETKFDGSTGWAASEKQMYRHQCGCKFVVIMK